MVLPQKLEVVRSKPLLAPNYFKMLLPVCATFLYPWEEEIKPSYSSEKKRLKEETEGRRESDGEKSDNEQLVVDVSNEVGTGLVIFQS